MLRMEELPWEWARSVANEGNIYTLDDIRSVVQLSDEELSYAVNKMPVVEHYGKIRWMSYDLQDRFLDLVVEAFDNPEMPFVKLTHLTAQALRSFLPKNVTDAIIDWFLRTMCKKTEYGDYAVDPDALSHARAAQVLRSAPKFEIHDFHKRADVFMPLGVTLNPSTISDISFQYDDANSSYISYMNIYELPVDPWERLRTLFSKKGVWKVEDVVLLFSDICPNSDDVVNFVLDECPFRRLKDGTLVCYRLQGPC